MPAGPIPGLETTTLVGGVIDGHIIWRADLDAALATLERLETVGAAAVAVGTSTSLLHVPHDVADEPHLDASLKDWLAFADQKVVEVVTLATGLSEGRETIHEALLAAADARPARAAAPGVEDLEEAVVGGAALAEGHQLLKGDDRRGEGGDAPRQGLAQGVGHLGGGERRRGDVGADRRGVGGVLDGALHVRRRARAAREEDRGEADGRHRRIGYRWRAPRRVKKSCDAR